MDKKSQKNFFLLSFIPALAYWYLEETQTITIAVIAGMTLSVLELALEWFFTKHIHSLSKLNFVLLFILGPISLIGEDGLWFKLQPMFTGIFLFAYLMLLKSRGESLIGNMTKDMELKNQLPEFIVQGLETHLAFFLLFFGFFMGYLAKFESTSTWAFYKTIGFYIAFAVFMVAEFFIIKMKVKKVMHEDFMKQVIEMSKVKK